MANSKKYLPSNQMELRFDKPNFTKLNQEIKQVVSKAIAGCEKSRWQIVEELSEMVGREITVTMLNHWTAESKAGHRLPGEIIPAFCIVTGNFDLMRLLCAAGGGGFAKTNEVALMEKARLYMQKEKIEREIKEVDRFLSKEKS